MAEIEYRILNVPMIGRDLAASRTPRLRKGASQEFNELLSLEVQAGDWTVDPDNGQPLNSKGETIQQRLERKIKETGGDTSHWIEPKVLEDEAEAVWLSETPSITARGKRLEQLEKFSGSKAAALVLFKEEAARYGVTNPFSTQRGSKPGEKKPDEGAATNMSNNPWSDRFKGDEAARAARIASIIKMGTKLANNLAKAAGTTVGKPLRRAS